MPDEDQIRVLLLPLDGVPALVPTAVVAEVTAYASPEPASGSPPWMLGFVRWRGQSVPLVSLEFALGRPPGIERLGRQKSMVVLYGMGGKHTIPYYAVATAGPPHPGVATEKELQGGRRTTGPYGWGRVELGELGAAEIPDLERLETDLGVLM